MAEALRTEGNIWAGYRKNKTDWFSEDLKAKHGPAEKLRQCILPDARSAMWSTISAWLTVRLLDRAGVDFTYAGKPENCCGTPMLVAGKMGSFEDIHAQKHRSCKTHRCGYCYCLLSGLCMMWRVVYPEWAKKLGIDYNIKTNITLKL